MIPNVKIIVVDEDKLVRDFTVDVLEFCVNREVQGFDNGSDAWDFIQTPDNAHVIISDAEIPVMNGFDLLKNIKSEFPEKTCIIMSHHYQNEKVANELGADAFLAKPFYIDELFELVQKYVVAAQDNS
jgi:DNA-binding NtrC family response regulator